MKLQSELNMYSILHKLTQTCRTLQKRKSSRELKKKEGRETVFITNRAFHLKKIPDYHQKGTNKYAKLYHSYLLFLQHQQVLGKEDTTTVTDQRCS